MIRALFADDEGALGDAFYTLDQAQAAISQVRRLADYFVKQGKPPQFSAAVGSVLSRFKSAAEQSEDELAPAIGSWGTLVQLGKEAEDLTSRIAVATGAEPPPSITKPSTFEEIKRILGLLAVLGVGGVVVVKAMEKRDAR